MSAVLSAVIVVAIGAQELRFRVDDSGVVHDRRTGLRWRKCPLGLRYAGHLCSGRPEMMSWAEAKRRCTQLREQNRNDWRLPSLDELRSLLDEGRAAPHFPLEYFGGAYPPLFWADATVTDSVGSHGQAFHFETGAQLALAGAQAYALCVRGTIGGGP